MALPHCAQHLQFTIAAGYGKSVRRSGSEPQTVAYDLRQPAQRGKSAGAAPNGSDSSQLGPTKTFLLEGIYWAANLDGTITSIKAANASFDGMMRTEKKNGVLNVSVSGFGTHEVGVYTLSGQNVAKRIGSGSADYSFNNLKGASVYLVRVKSAGKTKTERVAL